MDYSLTGSSDFTTFDTVGMDSTYDVSPMVGSPTTDLASQQQVLGGGTIGANATDKGWTSYWQGLASTVVSYAIAKDAKQNGVTRPGTVPATTAPATRPNSPAAMLLVIGLIVLVLMEK